MQAYPDAGEVVAVFLGGTTVRDPAEVAEDASEASWWALLPAEVRSTLNRQRAAARAQGRIRRYCVANQLDRLVTLTYRDEPTSVRQVKRDAAQFVRDLRALLGGTPLAYVYVVERGARGRLHVHLAVGRYLPKPLVERAWGRGFVDLRRGDRGGAAGAKREGARAAARYLAKYASKGLAVGGEAWSHAYERSQGFNVRVVRRRGLTLPDAAWVARSLLPGDVLEERSSEEWLDWCGPPCRVWVAI